MSAMMAGLTMMKRMMRKKETESSSIRQKKMVEAKASCCLSISLKQKVGNLCWAAVLRMQNLMRRLLGRQLLFSLWVETYASQLISGLVLWFQSGAQQTYILTYRSSVTILSCMSALVGKLRVQTDHLSWELMVILFQFQSKTPEVQLLLLYSSWLNQQQLWGTWQFLRMAAGKDSR